MAIARHARHLGAELGFFGILHRWVACLPGFFLPVLVLSAYFREHLPKL